MARFPLHCKQISHRQYYIGNIERVYHLARDYSTSLVGQSIQMLETKYFKLNKIRLRVHSFGMIWIRIADQDITQIMTHQRNRWRIQLFLQSTMIQVIWGSLILIQIIPKERTLKVTTGRRQSSWLFTSMAKGLKSHIHVLWNNSNWWSEQDLTPGSPAP